MTFLNLIPALLFAVAGLYAIYVLAKPIIRPMFTSFQIGSLLRKSKLKKKLSSLDQARSELLQGNLEAALILIEDSFFFDPSLYSHNFLDAVYDHNFEVLSLIIQLGKNYPANLSQLPNLERLIQDRFQIQKDLLENSFAEKLIKQKRSSKGKQTPEWALSEFSKKTTEAKSLLLRNQKDLEISCDLLFKSIRSLHTPDDEVTFH